MLESGRALVLGLAVAVLGGCGGEKPGSDTAGAAGATSASQPAATGAATTDTSGTSSPAITVDAASITPQMVALGDSVFHGRGIGGTCQTCHGPDAKGTALAPNLTDAQWLNGDGSYQFIVNTVTTGVPRPKQYPAPMPPMGGAPLTPEQVKAVAAYVYSLSRPGAT